MIREETLEAISHGVLDDDQLDEAIAHYEQLTDDLACHGTIYELVWRHSYDVLQTLEGYKRNREDDKKMPC